MFFSENYPFLNILLGFVIFSLLLFALIYLHLLLIKLFRKLFGVLGELVLGYIIRSISLISILVFFFFITIDYNRIFIIITLAFISFFICYNIYVYIKKYFIVKQVYKAYISKYDVDDIELISYYDAKNGKFGLYISYHEHNLFGACEIYKIGFYKFGLEDGEWHEYNYNGRLDIRCFYKLGLKNGFWEKYYSSGKLNQFYTYKNDFKDGAFNTYHPNGIIASSGNYKNLMLDGEIKYYHFNGFLESFVNYKHGYKYGLTKYFDFLGNEILIGSYINGYKEGEWIDFDISKNLKRSIFYSKGFDISDTKTLYPDSGIYEFNRNGIVFDFFERNIGDGLQIFYHDNGIKKCEGFYLNGYKNGLWNYYNEVGEIKNLISFYNGVKHGAFFEYQNGNVSLRGFYRNGMKFGNWERPSGFSTKTYFNGELKDLFFDIPNFKDIHLPCTWNDVFTTEMASPYRREFINSSNILESISVYYDGLIHGECLEFFNNNDLKSIGYFKNGVKDGEFIDFHENGNIKSKGLYKMGEKDGHWKEFDLNGFLKTEGEYKYGEKLNPWKVYN